MNGEAARIEAKIDGEIRAWNMLPRGCRVVAGFSGGADSVALLHFLCRHAAGYGVSLTAAHVNHGLRGEEADADERFVVRFCRRYGIELKVLHADVRALAREKSQGLEECGRDVRYSFFHALCGKDGRIATAHTLSDNAETILMNLARGAGAKGLCGIPPVRGCVVRPLLGVTRSEVELYCSVYGLDFVTDSTNLSDDFARNRIRHRVVPVLREINPEFEAAAARTSEILRGDEAYFERMAEGKLQAARLPDGGYRLEPLRELPRPALLRAIPMALGNVSPVRPGYGNILSVADLVRSGDGAVTTAGAVRCSASEGVLRLTRRGGETSSGEWSVPFDPSGTSLPDGRLLFMRSVPPGALKNHGKFHNLLFHNLFNYDTIINTNCTVRNRRPGDAYRPAGRGVTKSLKKLFNEAKVPVSARPRRAVLESGGRILWAEGFGTAEEACPTAGSKDIREIIVKECIWTVNSMDHDIREVLYSGEELQKIVGGLGARITEDYRGKNLLLVSILKGSVVFMSDLMRSITIPCSIDFMAVSSYGHGVKTSGTVKIIKDLDIDLKGWDVLVVEDILDSGLTLSYIWELLQSRSPKSIRLCTLFDKPDRRTVNIKADYVGTIVPDEFIVGYGLDYAEKYRNLPYVGVLKPEVYGG